jgi:hypothetical protein
MTLLRSLRKEDAHIEKLEQLDCGPSFPPGPPTREIPKEGVALLARTLSTHRNGIGREATPIKNDEYMKPA